MPKTNAENQAAHKQRQKEADLAAYKLKRQEEGREYRRNLKERREAEGETAREISNQRERETVYL